MMSLFNQPLSRDTRAGIALVALSCLTLYVLTGHEIFILDIVNLVFHEAGHAVFFFAPEFLVVLGGTLMQLTIPIACGIYFYTRREKVAACVMLWWLGQNLLGVSAYMGDARAQVLPLLGDGHDWAYLLSKIGLLPYDTVLEQAVLFIGLLCMLSSIVSLARYVWPLYQRWF